MSFNFEQSTLDDLKMLFGLDEEKLSRVCEACIGNLKRGAPEKKEMQGLAKMLGVATAQAMAATDALACIYAECNKKQLGQASFSHLITSLAIPKEQIPVLYKYYSENIKEIRTVLNQFSVRLPHYKNLNWRLELELSSRCLHHQASPSFLLELETVQSGTPASRLLQCSFGSMKNMVNQLDTALKELNSSHCRRMQTYIN